MRCYGLKESKRGKILLRGIGASAGVVNGPVRIAFDASEAMKNLRRGQVLVVSATDPSWTICMRKAAAIITNSGGILSHAAIVSRELNIPCVVGTAKATEVLHNGMNVRVDGVEGLVYSGSDKSDSLAKVRSQR